MRAKGRFSAEAVALLLCVVMTPMLLGDNQHRTSDARKRLLATKAALYDANFRNDRTALRAGIRQALEFANNGPFRPIALYYAAWGEWTLAHSQLQAGEQADAGTSLLACERYARRALALAPGDPEFIVMLADALIWRIVANPQLMARTGPEVRQLRTKALALGPNNPRAVMMDAGLIFNAPPGSVGSHEEGLARWQHAIELFEREASVSRDDLRPDWGLALSYGWVCDLYLAMRPKQVEAARAAAHKALELRPDFWYVREVVTPRIE